MIDFDWYTEYVERYAEVESFEAHYEHEIETGDAGTIEGCDAYS